MRKDQSRLVWGSLLVLVGILFMLQEFGILGNAFQYFWIVLMAVGSGVFLYIYFTKRDQWWAVIPGLTLLGLTLAGLAEIIPALPGGDWTGAIFLGCIGLAFWLVYFREQAHWWAIIPGGVLVTLGVVAGLDSISGWSDGIFFIGMGITFVLVAVLPNPSHDTRWALIPAGVLILLGITTFAPIKSLMNYIWPALLIALGVYILFRSQK